MIIAIAGASGTGKTYITNYLKQKLGAYIPLHITTRAPREDDNGFYKYVSIEQFTDMVKNDKFFISSGDGIRNYGVEFKEIIELESKGKIQIINISLKDIGYLTNENAIIIFSRYKKFILDFFTHGVIKKVGMYEAICRFYIYIYDWFKYRRDIKRYVDIVYTSGDSLELLLNHIEKIIEKKRPLPKIV